jgi:FAD/FMN-containing dehydrogenase
MKRVRSWGLLSNDEHEVQALTERDQVTAALQSHTCTLAHGAGRSYGDVCLNPQGHLLLTTSLDKFIHFDDETGQLTCEAGVLLRDIQRLFVPRGWMLPVTPGTQYVTVGGAIANDVHGKNHHALGSFGDHVVSLALARSSGEVLQVQAQDVLMQATLGGLGLTGVIISAVLQLRRVASPWLQAETSAYASLDEFFARADAAEHDWEHTVSWIDCLSGKNTRGIFLRARPLPEAQVSATDVSRLPQAATRTRSMPFVPPVSLVNRLTLKPFNALYFHANKLKAGQSLVHYEPFFHPLDNLAHWNRMYGPRGFYQYQSVVPRQDGQAVVQAMLQAIAQSGEGSFLAVLKTFGERQSKGLLSFPMPGVTLALDFPNRGESTLRLFDRLDAIVREAGGRLYMAKDARMSRAMFEAGYPRWQEFLTYRDPAISSAMSRRLMGW